MMDFFKNWLKRETSSATAKERLRLVLLSDHLSLAPDVVENLRRDLIAVISRYVEVDEAHCDVSFEQQDSAVAMLANIPILKMKTPPPGGGAPRTQASPPAAPPTGMDGAAPAMTVAEPAVTVPALIHAVETAAEAPVGAGLPAPKKRRRRRRPANPNPAGGAQPGFASPAVG